MIEIFENLKKLGSVFPWNESFVDKESIKNLESVYSVVLPESYKFFLENYSNISLGSITVLKPLNYGSYLDIHEVINEMTSNDNFPVSYFPFVYDNGDCYCFDTNAEGTDYKVVFWSHDGLTNETWNNFLEWVEKCWIGENI